LFSSLPSLIGHPLSFGLAALERGASESAERKKADPVICGIAAPPVKDHFHRLLFSRFS
jgi:hypothetical protein